MHFVYDQKVSNTSLAEGHEIEESRITLKLHSNTSVLGNILRKYLKLPLNIIF